MAAGALLLLVGQASPLTVTSDPPGAAVYVDDALVGETPVTAENVPAGPHRVRVLRVGYLENVQVLDVIADQPIVHHVRLTPILQQPAATLSTSSTASEPPPAETVDRPWFAGKRWLWIGLAGGGGAVAAASLRGSPEVPLTAGTVFISPSTGLQGGTTITFASQGSDGGSGSPLTHTWNFGNGSSAIGALVTHVYNSAGTFSVTVDVSDGKTSATATGSIAIKSLTGTWRGTLAGVFDVTMTLTQTGTTVAGTYRDQVATGAITGTVRPASPSVNLTIGLAGFPLASYAADPAADVNTLTGSYRQQGLTLDLRMTRQ
jgi:hypothetical protein